MMNTDYKLNTHSCTHTNQTNHHEVIRNINIKFTRFAQNLHVLFYGFERNGITKNRKKQATKEKELTK